MIGENGPGQNMMLQTICSLKSFRLCLCKRDIYLVCDVILYRGQSLDFLKAGS
jgi:hypothetical protein